MSADEKDVFLMSRTFIWNEFSRRGYATLLSDEDEPMFNNGFGKFTSHPTGVHLQPFAMKMVVYCFFKCKKSTFISCRTN